MYDFSGPTLAMTKALLGRHYRECPPPSQRIAASRELQSRSPAPLASLAIFTFLAQAS